MRSPYVLTSSGSAREADRHQEVEVAGDDVALGVGGLDQRGPGRRGERQLPPAAVVRAEGVDEVTRVERDRHRLTFVLDLKLFFGASLVVAARGQPQRVVPELQSYLSPPLRHQRNALDALGESGHVVDRA